MNTLREPADAQWILPTFFSKFILMMRGKCESRKRLSDSVEITQDVSQWYRECQSCRKKSPLQLLWSAEHDLCGRLGFIHTKSTAWKLLLESDSSGLEKGIMCHASVKKNYQNYQITRFWDLWHRPITRCHLGPTGNFCTDSQKLCKIREGFGTELLFWLL